jgi:hypothetical protein
MRANASTGFFTRAWKQAGEQRGGMSQALGGGAWLLWVHFTLRINPLVRSRSARLATTASII